MPDAVADENPMVPESAAPDSPCDRKHRDDQQGPGLLLRHVLGRGGDQGVADERAEP